VVAALDARRVMPGVRRLRQYFSVILKLMNETLIATLSAIAGFIGKALWDFYFAKKKERETLALTKKIEFLERQLSEFYWPVYLRLQKSTIVTNRIHDVREEQSSLKFKLIAEIEKSLILPNHDETVKIIETHIYLAQPDEKLTELLLKYINHVAVYKALRSAGEYKLLPYELGEGWPFELFPEVQKRTYQIQEEYNKLIAFSQRKAPPNNLFNRSAS
jgi:hypothetical protein